MNENELIESLENTSKLVVSTQTEFERGKAVSPIVINRLDALLNDINELILAITSRSVHEGNGDHVFGEAKLSIDCRHLGKSLSGYYCMYDDIPGKKPNCTGCEYKDGVSLLTCVRCGKLFCG